MQANQKQEEAAATAVQHTHHLTRALEGSQFAFRWGDAVGAQLDPSTGARAVPGSQRQHLLEEVCNQSRSVSAFGCAASRGRLALLSSAAQRFGGSVQIRQCRRELSRFWEVVGGKNRSPSPPPSPAGRGRLPRALHECAVSALAAWASADLKRHACCSLSQRERGRVRESRPSSPGGCHCLRCSRRSQNSAAKAQPIRSATGPQSQRLRT